MICKNCGAQLEDGQKFCMNCGQPIENDDAAAEDAPSTICSNCGAEIESGHNFCMVCGLPIELQSEVDGQDDTEYTDDSADENQAYAEEPIDNSYDENQPAPDYDAPAMNYGQENEPNKKASLPVGAKAAIIALSVVCILAVATCILFATKIFNMPTSVITGESDTQAASQHASESEKQTTETSATSETTTTAETTSAATEAITQDSSKVVEPEYEFGYADTYVVNADGGLFLRYGPGTNYEKICLMPDETVVEVLGSNVEDKWGDSENKWLYVKFNDVVGWSSAEFLEFIGGIAKPLIYLYPEDETDLFVNIKLKSAKMFCTYPEMRDGWNVTAYPDGKIINHADGQEYSYLFWEANGDIEFDFSTGFVVKGCDSAEFLQEKLSEIGLTPREYNEFIVYWLPKMQVNKYNLISFQGKAYTDEAEIEISQKPDSVLRVFMAYKPLDEEIEIEPQTFEKFERNGFTLVEWGGREVR